MTEGEEQGFGMEEDESGALTVDLSGTNESSGEFEPIPRADYPCILDELEFGHSQASGNPMWTWVWVVEGGDHDGRKLWYHTTFTETGMPRVKRALNCLKTDDDYSQELLSTPFDPQVVVDEGRLLGGRATLRVGQRRYDGRMTNNVRDVMPPQTDAFA